MASFEDLTDEQRTNLARAAHKLFQNSEVSRQAKKLLMKADPTVKFADIEQEEATNVALKERDEQIKALQNKQIEQEARERRAEFHAKCRAKGLDPADVEKTITDYKVMDFDKAIEITERLQTIAPASAESPYDAVKMPTDKELLKDPTGFSRKMATEMIDQFRGRRRPAA